MAEKTVKITPAKLKKMKKKLPKFFRSNYGRRDRKRVKDNWRHPRGIDNKKAQKIKTFGAEVNIGYRNPKGIRGMHPRALQEVRVFNLQQLLAVPKTTAVRIAAAVGGRKKETLLAKARSMGLIVLNQ